MEPRHLFHSALTRLPGGNALHLKSKHLLVPAHNISSFIWRQQNCGRGGSPMECGVAGEYYETPYFHLRHRHLPEMALPRTVWVRLNRFHTGVGLSAPAYTNGHGPSASCECGAEEQTIDNAVLHCLTHRPPHGLHVMAILDDETIEWLLNTCPEI